jgi:hypothetical protein
MSRAPVLAVVPEVMVSARVVLILFLVVQACDGIFTYVAVRADGIAAEGNMVLATWMMLVGPAPTLFAAKLVAAACGVLLYVRGVHRVLALLTILYTLGAIGPWIFVLQSR